MTALGVGVLVWVLAGLLVGQTKKVKAALAAAAVGLVFAIQSLLDELRTRPDDPFSSVAVRRAFNEASLQLWQEHPFLGVGIHYWRDRYFLKRAFEGGPVNVVAEHLAEGGVVALVGFVALVVGMLVALSQARSDLAATAAAVLVARVAHGTVDIYWVAVQTSVTFVVVGAALADTTGRRATETGEAVRLPWSRPRAVLDAPQRARA
jgi:O-antigen ligase